MKSRVITVKGVEVAIATQHEQDYISLTDMLRNFGDESILYNWLRNRNTIEFLGILEQLYNPGFKPIEFDRFRSQAGLNRFALSPKKWIEATGAIGLYAKAGRGGGTFAHRATSLEWNFQRTLAKVNYKIHTDAIKERLIPPRLTKAQTGMVYASEADSLNVALFGITAAQWRPANPGSPREHNGHANRLHVQKTVLKGYA